MAVILPIVLTPLLTDFENKARLCAYVLLLMIFYWVFEAINLYATGRRKESSKSKCFVYTFALTHTQHSFLWRCFHCLAYSAVTRHVSII